MVFNATFNNISAISCLSVLFVDETGEKTQLPAANHWKTLSHNFVSSTPRLNGIRTRNVTGMYVSQITTNILLFVGVKFPSFYPPLQLITKYDLPPNIDE
jgi:hypothetical protein